MSISTSRRHGDATRTRDSKAYSSFEMDDLSESVTIASLETSSTLTAYTTTHSADGHISNHHYPKTSLSSQGDPALVGLLRTIATAETRESLQRALAAVFSFVCDGQSHLVVEALACCGSSRDELLEQLAGYEPSTPVYKRGWYNTEKPKEWTTELRRQFLTELLRYHWDTLTESSAERWCSLFEEKHTILKYLFPTSTAERHNTPPHIDLVHIYFARPDASWPSLVRFEETQFRHVPPEWPITNIAHILPSTHPTPATSVLINYILTSTKPHTNNDPTPHAVAELDRLLLLRTCTPRPQWSTAHFLKRHPASPALWMALYLASGNAYVAGALVKGGIVANLGELYELEFPDPRDNMDVAAQSAYDLLRMVHVLLCVLFAGGRHKAKSGRGSLGPCGVSTGKQGKEEQEEEDVWMAAKEMADELKENVREDLRYYARQMTARYHDADTLYRDEIEAEVRDALFMRQVRRGG